MIAVGSNVERERERSAANAEICGREKIAGETWFCSRSCEEIGHHFLIVPEPHETYDDVLARARVEGV